MEITTDSLPNRESAAQIARNAGVCEEAIEHVRRFSFPFLRMDTLPVAIWETLMCEAHADILEGKLLSEPHIGTHKGAVHEGW